jgi:cell division septal protein FtsQ
MRIIFTVIFLLAFGVISYIWLTPAFSPLAEVSLPNNKAVDPDYIESKIVESLPDYDLREKKGNTVVTQVINESLSGVDVDIMLEKSEAALQALVVDYDQVLSDPEAKKMIEQQASEVGKEHKKAVLAKLRNGEL